MKETHLKRARVFRAGPGAQRLEEEHAVRVSAAASADGTRVEVRFETSRPGRGATVKVELDAANLDDLYGLLSSGPGVGASVDTSTLTVRSADRDTTDSTRRLEVHAGLVAPGSDLRVDQLVRQYLATRAATRSAKEATELLSILMWSVFETLDVDHITCDGNTISRRGLNTSL